MNMWKQKTNQVYDEKQLQDRGKVYQYSFFAALLTVAAAYFVTQALEVQINAYALFLFCMWIPLTTCLILLIWKNAYEGVGSTAGRTATAVLGAAGIFLVAYCVYEMIWQGERVFRDGMITRQAGPLFMGGCMMLVCAVYWIKQLHDRNRFPEE